METPVSLFTWRRFGPEETSRRVSGKRKDFFQTPICQALEANAQDHGILTFPRTPRDIAKVIRSKNAGSFEVTLNIMFEDARVFNEVKDSCFLDAETITKLFSVATEGIVWCGFFEQALASKATLPRTRRGTVVCSEGFMEDDVHGSQQYMPLLELELELGRY